jgi:hypothetical protein
MNRKKFFCILWASVFLTRLRFEGLGGLVGNIPGSAIEAFSVPGWLLVFILRHAAHLTGEGLAIAILGAAAFWFFPIARLRRAVGNYHAFKDADAARPRLLRLWAFVLDANDKRKFGTTKTGGWS